MKNKILFYIVITSSLSFTSWAQKPPLNENKLGESQNDSLSNNDKIYTPRRRVKYYHVEEIIPLQFGGRKIVYDVSKKDLINTYDLGPNNIRIITPVYGEEEQIDTNIIKSATLKKIENSTELSINNNPKKIDTHDLESNNKKITPVITEQKQPDKPIIKLAVLKKNENSTKLLISNTPKKVEVHDLVSNNEKKQTPVIAEKVQLDKTIIKPAVLNKIENSIQLSTSETPKKVEVHDLASNNEKKLTPVITEKVQLDKTIIKPAVLNKIENSIQLSTTEAPKKVEVHDLVSNNKKILTPIIAEKVQLEKPIVKLDALNEIKNSIQLSTSETQKKVEEHDLVSNNEKILTPIVAEKVQLEKPIIKLDALNVIENSTKSSISEAPKKVDSHAYIDIVDTYERVTDNGYESIDMLKKVANSYFFKNELEKAEKYYSKLFSKSSDLEPEYYYRYSISLKSIGDIKKSNEYLKKFNQLSNNKS